jgi:3-isopropylmalate/(R)-2-methylmalate dehydratase large subunit
VPGMIAIGTDSHALTGGALGAVVVGMGATDAAIAAAKGRVWLRVPETVKITLDGKLPAGTMSRDIMFYFMGQKGWDGSEAGWAYQAIELGGETVKTMSMDSRLSLCNLASDTGAKNAIIPPDEITWSYLAGKKRETSQPLESDLQSDRGATYGEEISMDVSMLEPQVACPHSPDNVKPLSQVLGRKIDVATVASCSNGRLEDLHVAATILNGRNVHRDVRMIVSPASQKIYAEAVRDGTISTLVSAGVVVGHPTCGPCYGGQLSGLGDGEVLIGSIPRNLQGRLGSPKSEIYSANPAVVAASAIRGVISDPREFL